MNILRFLSAVSCFCAVFMFNQAFAAPVNYDEAASGDIGVISGFTVFTLDVGLNTISGSDAFTTSGFDVDAFSVVVPVGMSLTSVTYGFSNVNLLPGTTNLGFGNATIDNGTTVIDLYSTNIVTATSPISMFSSLLPLSANNYGLSNNLRRQGDGGTWDYTWTFEVAAVPIPPALWLFGSGLLGLIGMAKKKSS